MNTPQAPDPYATAAAQTQSNKQTAQSQQELNMVNQSNPYGSLTYSQTGTNSDGTPQYTASTSLTPQTQALLNQYQGIQQQQGQTAQKLLSSGAGALGGGGLDLSYNGTAASLDALNRARLDPYWNNQTDLEQSKLAAQGLTPGTAGYDNAMSVFNQGKNDAYNSANLADYTSAANTAYQQYMAPVQAYQSLVSGTSPTMPTFQSTPTVNVPATNVAGLVEQNYQQQVSQNNAMMGGLFGLGGTVGGALLGGPLGASLGGALGSSLGGTFGGLSQGQAFNNSNMNSPYYGPLN